MFSINSSLTVDREPRVQLTPVAFQHLKPLSRFAEEDRFAPEFAIAIPYIAAPARASVWLACINQERTRRSAEVFAVIDEGFNGVVGAVRLSGMLAPGSCQLSYWIARPFRSRGYATAAGRLALKYAADAFARRRVCSFVNPDNFDSLRVLEKLHFETLGSLVNGALYLERLLPSTWRSEDRT